jgi:UDP-N-acetylmuramate dehydrogenase
VNLIQSNIPLHTKNWFGTGGPARFYAEPTTADEFAQALNYAKNNSLEITLLGQGANSLISDAGFDGLLIRPQLDEISFERETAATAYVKADAGVCMDRLIEWCLAHQLSGLEEFSGIPGTVGGSVFINLHYFEFLLSQFLVSAEVIDKSTGEVTTVDQAWFQFGYDYSTLHEQTHYLVSATFKLKSIYPLDIAFAHGRRKEIIRHRASRYPQSGTCGSFFRNFLPHELEQEKTGIKLPYVAYYLDKIGVKGNLSVGKAIVSHQHANMIVCKPGGTSSDIVTLARTMQQKVADQFGIIPQPECQLVGFCEYPFIHGK